MKSMRAYTFDMARWSNAAELNKDAIQMALRDILTGGSRVLEIASGTGQHVVHFAKHMPDIWWQPTELPELLPDLYTRVKRSGLANIMEPVCLDVRRYEWLVDRYDAIYIGDLLHFLHYSEISNLIAKISDHLVKGGHLLVYGPVKEEGGWLSDEDLRLEGWIREHDFEAGIPQCDTLDRISHKNDMVSMPAVITSANRRICMWESSRS